MNSTNGLVCASANESASNISSPGLLISETTHSGVTTMMQSIVWSTIERRS